MKKATYFLAISMFFNVLLFTSCTANDPEEDQLSITTQDVFATGDEGSSGTDNTKD